MKLSDKIIRLRKVRGWSQEDLAEKLNVSRQAVSRWENATVQPDATNILQLSRLFNVTTDYLLHDEYESDNDLPKVKQLNSDGIYQIMIFMITLEVMILIVQFITTIILQNTLWGTLSFVPFVAVIGGFEYAYQKKSYGTNETASAFRTRFYKLSAWLGTYFPTRLATSMLTFLYPRPYSAIAFEVVTLAAYLVVVILLKSQIGKQHSKCK